MEHSGRELFVGTGQETTGPLLEEELSITSV